jgi:DAACS family dicarboxylate/amino acid:cation (Na+ or H+) symporter
MVLWCKIFIGLVLGVFTGIVLGPHAEIFKPVGNIFMNLTSMIIVPLVLSSIVVGIACMRGPKKLSRMGFKTLSIYLFSSVFAVLLGVSVASIFNPGVALGGTLPPLLTSSAETPVLRNIILSLVPENPVTALVEGNILQIIVFALFLGVAINLSGERGKPLVDFFESMADVMNQLTTIVMEFSPVGAFAIMAWVSGSFGVKTLYPLLKFLGIYYAACLLHVFIVYLPILSMMAKVHPLPFFRGMIDAVMIAFSTCSSLTTLPISMNCVQKKLGVSRNIASFVLPLGATVNMNGAALFQGMGAIFITQVYGIKLGLYNLVAIIITSTFSAIASAGVPGSGFIMLSYVISSAGLPLEGLTLFVSIDRIREMGSTVVNILGDAVCAVYVAKQEGELNERQYYNERLMELEGDEV